MKRVLACSLVLLFVIGSGCGGDTQDSLAGEATSTMKEMVTTLESVKDEASANAAKPKLKSLADKMKDLDTRRGKLPAATEADMKSMEAKYGKDMEQLARKFQSEVMRIRFDPKLSPALDDPSMK